MAHRNKYLGMLPVRAGSKGLPGKNIKILNGMPLMFWAAKALVNSKKIKHCICSTDSEKYAQLAREYGLSVPFLRPKHLAEDKTPIFDVTKHAIAELSKIDLDFSHVVIVQATSPTITGDILDRAIDSFEKSSAESLISCFIDDTYHPSIMFEIENNRVNWLENDASKYFRRQDYRKVYIRTGLVYIHHIDNINKYGSLYGKNIYPFIIPKNISITIDDEYDFINAQFIMDKLNEKL